MSIPFEKIGSTPKRGSEAERDHAAIALIGYLIGVLQFDGISDLYRDDIMQRVNKVRQTQGLTS